MTSPQLQMETLFIEHMTTAEIEARVRSGWHRVIISSGSIEQHGRHLPLDTDYILARELAHRAARRLDKTLVAPIIPIGCAEHHMAFPGTLSVPRDVFVSYVENTARSLIRHGFNQLLFASFHGGNFASSLEAVDRIRSNYPTVSVHTALDLGKLFDVTNGVIRESFPDRTALDCHAGCVETSMMYHLNPDYVRAPEVVDGAVFTEIPPLDDIQAVSPTGILGLVKGYSSRIGESLFDKLVEFMIRSWGLNEESI